MATNVLSADLVSDNALPAASALPSRKPSWPRRLFDFIVESQTRRARRELARIIEAKGLHFITPDERIPPPR